MNTFIKFSQKTNYLLMNFRLSYFPYKKFIKASLPAKMSITMPPSTFPSLLIQPQTVNCPDVPMNRQMRSGGKEKKKGGGQQLRVIRRCCEKMAVAGCVFDLNRGNFSAITKFIGTALVCPTRSAANAQSSFSFFYYDRARSCLICGRIEKTRKKQQLWRRCTH